MYGWDTETGLIQPGLLAPPLACLSFVHKDDLENPQLIHWQDPACKRWAIKLLEEESTTANGAYDLGIFANEWPDLFPLIFDALDNGRVHDVQIRQKLFDIGEGCYRFAQVIDPATGEPDEDPETGEPIYRSVRYGLSDLHKRFCGEALEKDEWRLKYGRLRLSPLSSWPEGAKYYPKLDAVATVRVHLEQLQQDLRAEPEVYLYNEPEQCQAAFALQLISAWGFKTDAEAIQAFIKKLDREQVERFRLLVKTKLVRPDGVRDEKVARARMVEVMGDKCELTPKGLKQYRAWWAQMTKIGVFKKSTPEVVARLKQQEKAKLIKAGYASLKKDICKRSKDAALVKYAEYGGHKTLRTKVSRLAVSNMPVQTSFEVLLETGRTSSFASKILNNSLAIQNLPRAEGMRECFVARDGCVIISCDYGMAELVSLGEVCFMRFGQSALRDALNAGKDPHLMLAANLVEKSYEELYTHRKEDWVKELRQMCKAASFGFPGGLGIEKFIEYARAGYGVELTEEKARALKDKWLATWPEMKLYFQWIGSLCDNEEGLCDIVQHVSKRVRGRITYTVACNSLFQGLTADAAKKALYEVVRRCYADPTSVLYGARVVNFIHDEILLECKKEKYEACAKELSRIMVDCYKRYTPNTRITAEPSVMYRWSKHAGDAVYHPKTGKLLVFEDWKREFAPRKAA